MGRVWRDGEWEFGRGSMKSRVIRIAWKIPHFRDPDPSVLQNNGQNGVWDYRCGDNVQCSGTESTNRFNAESSSATISCSHELSTNPRRSFDLLIEYYNRVSNRNEIDVKWGETKKNLQSSSMQMPKPEIILGSTKMKRQAKVFQEAVSISFQDQDVPNTHHRTRREDRYRS